MKLHSFKYVLILGLAMTGGCATYAEYGGVPTLEESIQAPVAAAPYRIDAGDSLQVRFYRNPELDQLVVVRPDGYVSLPFVDDVKVAGKTPQEVDVDLTQRYRGELAVPDVSVIVQGFGGQRIYVGGEVGGEGVHPLVGGLTLYQAIDQAGGFLDTAHRRQVIVIRKGPDGRPTGHSIDLRQVEHGTEPEKDILLQPYDIVYVPKSKIANVNLFIQQYIRGLLPIDPAYALTRGLVY
jgi:protein involved in polysaccharide export with SLBB domain